MYEWLYRIMEKMDGEKNATRYIPYRYAQKIKVFCLTHIE